MTTTFVCLTSRPCGHQRIKSSLVDARARKISDPPSHSAARPADQMVKETVKTVFSFIEGSLPEWYIAKGIERVDEI